MSKTSTAYVRKLITQLKGRPLMYLRRLSLRDFDAYISGYCHGIDSAIPGPSSSYAELGAFGDWIRKRYGADKRMEWEDVLLEQKRGDDSAALDEFFARWDEFLATREGVD
jgi:hypothetical protein